MRFFGSEAYDNTCALGFALALIFTLTKLTGFIGVSWWYICIPLMPVILLMLAGLLLCLIELSND